MRALEIGSFEGKGAIGLATLLGSQAQVVCLDPFKEYEGNDLRGRLSAAEKRFCQNIAVSPVGQRITHYRVGLDEFRHRGEFDIIYIDGSHIARDVIADALAADRILKPGGMLIFDDYGWIANPDPMMQPGMAIDFFIKSYGDRYELIERDFRIFLRKNE